jgi:hypothetical protein
MPNGRAVSFASPSVATLVGEAAAKEWVCGRTHTLPTPPSPAPLASEPIACATLDELVACAWGYAGFSCSLHVPHDVPSRHGIGAALLEVSGSTNEQLPDGRVIIARDIADRQRLVEAEKEALRSRVALERDEEVRGAPPWDPTALPSTAPLLHACHGTPPHAPPPPPTVSCDVMWHAQASRFVRHEVKNSVLSALAQCDQLRNHHQRRLEAKVQTASTAPTAPSSAPSSAPSTAPSSAPSSASFIASSIASFTASSTASGAYAQVDEASASATEAARAAEAEAAYAVRQSAMLECLSSGLQETLETVLAQAMARELVHGVYVSRAVRDTASRSHQTVM